MAITLQFSECPREIRQLFRPSLAYLAGYDGYRLGLMPDVAAALEAKADPEHPGLYPLDRVPDEHLPSLKIFLEGRDIGTIYEFDDRLFVLHFLQGEEESRLVEALKYMGQRAKLHLAVDKVAEDMEAAGVTIEDVLSAPRGVMEARLSAELAGADIIDMPH